MREPNSDNCPIRAETIAEGLEAFKLAGSLEVFSSSTGASLDRGGVDV
jgi:hypothetical protein